ncbi:ABC transporter permease subunit [Dactylosporangium darangshiense]|uniref:DUF1349 domain-containing protein n=1 Tax=Dactylosporangium darangshiense TaxID=579108 RepID=A0ABP8DT96_9ACTN
MTGSQQGGEAGRPGLTSQLVRPEPGEPRPTAEHSPGLARITGRAVRAEWTKLTSVRSTGLAVLAIVAFTMLLSILSASLSSSPVNDGVLKVDQFHFVHQPMSGDATVTARVAAQTASAPWAKAGIMVKADATSGSPYVALMVTPRHGVLMQADAKTELTGRATGAPMWLRLTRSGQTFAGATSADGRTWTPVGTLTVADLPSSAEAGIFVGSPPYVHFVTVNDNSTKQYDPTLGEATFDHVALGAAAGSKDWRDTDVTPPPTDPPPPPYDFGLPYIPPVQGGSVWHDDGTVTVRGGGDIGMAGMGGINLADMDRVKGSLIGVQFGLIGAIAVGVLFMTSEFKTRTIGTTFAASPRRGVMLAAKAIVLTGFVFLTGLIVGLAAFLITRPMQRRNGYRPPAYPEPSITDPAVIRAILGTAAFLALIALLSLAVGAMLRRTAGALLILLTLMVVVPSITPGISSGADAFVRRATPIAGMSIQQTMAFPPGSTEAVTGPWTGFLVLCAYTAVALAGAFWLLRRRDA